MRSGHGTDGGHAAGPRSGWPLIAICTGYFMVILDTTVVNVALPSLGRALETGTTGLQWVVEGYTLILAGFLLPPGALDGNAASPALVSPCQKTVPVMPGAGSCRWSGGLLGGLWECRVLPSGAVAVRVPSGWRMMAHPHLCIAIW